MAEHSTIEWTDATWNPVTGCAIVSPGCARCYAMKLAGTRLKHHPSRAGLTVDSKAGPVWNGQVRLNEGWLDQPLRWKRPRRIFVCAHGDLFAEAVPDEWIDRVFAVMALAPQHTFQVLTKRASRMRRYLSTRAGDWMIVWPDANPPGTLPISRHEQRLAMQGKGWPDAIIRPTFPLANVWLGVSAERQQEADERVPELLATPAAIRFVSAEPLLGPIDLTQVNRGTTIRGGFNCLESGSDTISGTYYEMPALDWIIAGGESGDGARPMHPDWARSIRDQCFAAGVPFFFKQWGLWEVALDRDRDDPDWRADYSRKFTDGGRYKWLNLRSGCGFHGERFHVMRNVGKKTAGRLLDGVEHSAFPRIP